MGKISMSYKRSNKGFTLIELAIVMVIVGIFASALATVAKHYVISQRLSKMEQNTRDIRTSLNNYIADDIPAITDPLDPNFDPNDPALTDAVNFPCPASLTAGPESPLYGQSNCAPGGGVFRVNGVNGPVLIGAVPIAELNLSVKHMIDPYNNRLTYAVTQSLTAPNVLQGQPSLPQGDITVLNEGGGILTAGAQFIITSHGSDGAGSFTSSGRAHGTACRGGGDGDAQNCAWQLPGGTAVFRSQNAFNLAQGVAGYYDDNVVFSLSGGDDDQWWSATDNTNQHISNNNPGNVLMATTGGNVGIGTATPDALLTVAGPMHTTGGFGTILYGPHASNASQDVPAGDGFRLRYDQNLFAPRRDALVFEKTDGNRDDPDGGIAFVNRGQDNVAEVAMVIRGEGNVGIGTDAPQTSLDVIGTMRAVDDPQTPTQCTTSIIGATRYNPTLDGMEYCAREGGFDANGNSIPAWKAFGGGGGLTIGGIFIPEGTEISCENGLGNWSGISTSALHYAKIINGAIYTRSYHTQGSSILFDSDYVQGNSATSVTIYSEFSGSTIVTATGLVGTTIAGSGGIGYGSRYYNPYNPPTSPFAFSYVPEISWSDGVSAGATFSTKQCAAT